MRFLPFILAGLLSINLQAATLTGRVVGVHDGDTITVLGADKSQHKLRLAALDAPERKQPRYSSKAELVQLDFRQGFIDRVEQA